MKINTRRCIWLGITIILTSWISSLITLDKDFFFVKFGYILLVLGLIMEK